MEESTRKKADNLLREIREQMTELSQKMENINHDLNFYYTIKDMSDNYDPTADEAKLKNMYNETYILYQEHMKYLESLCDILLTEVK